MDRAKAGQVDCQICLNNTSKYFCPRCNVSYCGLKCYRAPCHSQCSEDFYKESVYNELQSQGKLDPQSKKKTVEILQKLRNSENDAELDSDDDDDLNYRLAQIDLEDADSVWQVLTAEERLDFQKKVDSGEIYKLVPAVEKTQIFQWWEIYSPPKKVTEICNAAATESVLSPQLPPLSPPLSLTQIDVSKSSPLVKFNIMNVLAAYAMAYRHLNWQCEKKCEKRIFAHEVISLSTNLRSGENFTSADLALTSVTSFMAQCKTYDKALISSVKKDVLSLIQGPGEGMGSDDLYILAALSDLKSVFDKDDKENRSSKKQWKQIGKKLDFYMCWTVKNIPLFRLK